MKSKNSMLALEARNLVSYGSFFPRCDAHLPPRSAHPLLLQPGPQFSAQVVQVPRDCLHVRAGVVNLRLPGRRNVVRGDGIKQPMSLILQMQSLKCIVSVVQEAFRLTMSKAPLSITSASLDVGPAIIARIPAVQ